MTRMYDLHYVEMINGKATPGEKVGGNWWTPMTHDEAVTVKSKFTNPSRLMLVELKPLEMKIRGQVVKVGRDGKKNCYRAEAIVDGQAMATAHFDFADQASVWCDEMVAVYRKIHSK